jgi:diguanylate cyclase (GGDEF)-like protein/PAS domain S-box-containing protein
MSLRGKPEGKNSWISLSKATLARMGVFVKNLDGTVEFANRFWTDLGYDADQLSGENWLDLVHPEDRDAAVEFLRKLTDHELDHGRMIYRIRSSSGDWRWCMTSGMTETDPVTGTHLYVGHDQDITYIKQLQRDADEARALAEKQADEAETLRVAGAIIAASLDKQEMIRRVVDQLRRLLPVEHCIVFERNGRELNSFVIDLDDADSPVPFFKQGPGYDQVVKCMRTGLPAAFQDPRLSRRFWLSVPLVIRGEPEGVCMMSRIDGKGYYPVDVRKALAIADFLAVALNNGRLYEAMSMLATTDQLSGLLNRHAFFLEARQALEEARNNSGSVTCLVADIDFFKAINDDFGHMVGDKAIRAVAEVIRGTLRDVDTVGRYGGEEFCALLPGVAEREAFLVADRVRASVEELTIEGIDRRITCSIGAASLSAAQTGASPHLDSLLSAADASLYEAKRAGRNRVETTTI